MVVIVVTREYIYFYKLIITYTFHTLCSFGNFFGIVHGYRNGLFVKSTLTKNLKFSIMPPLSNGDPCFFGHTFMYDIFIQERYSHVVRFLEIR